jgi:PKD repeat protein
MLKAFKIFSVVLSVLVIGAGVYSCKKEKGGSLGATPKADFVMVPGSNPNNITLINKSNTPSIPYWKLSSSQTLLQGDSAIANFIFAGNYTVTLYVAAQGGLDSLTKPITIAQSDPTACQGTPLGFIAGCNSKTWKLDPAAGAYKVGPGPNDGSWWASGAGDVTGRSCEFNDEYTFSFNAAGTFKYDNKGDFYGDGYLGNNSGSCQPASNYKPNEAPWGSGTFRYTFTANAGNKKLGQITLIGKGAHIGLQKVRNGGENTTTPAESITYDVLDMKHVDAGNYDLLTLGVDLGYGWWTFTLRSF